MDVETIALKTATSVVVDIFKRIIGGLADSASTIKSAGLATDPLGLSAKEYAKYLGNRYGSVRVLGMQKALPIDRIYVGANILEQPTMALRSSIDDLEKTFDKDRRSLSPIVSTLPASNLLDREELVISKESIAKIRKRYDIPDYHISRVYEVTAQTFSTEKTFRQTLFRLCPKDEISFALDRKWELKKGYALADKFANELVNLLTIRPKHYVLLGKPGAGKTTFLKHLTAQALRENRRNNRLPIFISLKDWSDSKLELMPFITKEFEVCDFKEPERFVVKALEKGTCLVLFDGLDEVKKTKESEIIDQIEMFCGLYAQNQFVITCRIAAYSHWFTDLDLVEVADFQDNQIQSFIKNWFLNDPRIASDCWKKMQQDTAIRELATTPLLLTLLCLSFEQTLDFPSNRSELYREGVDALLRKWDSSRGISRGEIYKHLSPQRKESMLAYIAAQFFKRDEYFFPQRTLVEYVSDFINNLPGVENGKTAPDSTIVLEEMEAQHGLIVTRAKGVYSFSHLTFQEYFCARYAIENASDGEIQELVDNSLKPNWREVILLAAGMLPRADKFLELLAYKICNETLTPEVRIILNECKSLCRPGASYSEATVMSLAFLARVSIGTDSEELISKTLTMCRIIAKANGDSHVLNSVTIGSGFGIGKNFFQLVNHRKISKKPIEDTMSMIAWVEASSTYFECLCNEAYADRTIRNILSDEILTLS